MLMPIMIKIHENTQDWNLWNSIQGSRQC